MAIDDSLNFLCDEELSPPPSPVLSTKPAESSHLSEEPSLPETPPLSPMECLPCNEPSSFRSPSPSREEKSPRVHVKSPPLYICTTNEELDETFKNYLERENAYRPQIGYAEFLRSDAHLALARAKAVRWIVSVSVLRNLSCETTYNAVNYLDRFVSVNCSTNWEEWMMDLLSVTCLSISAKVEEDRLIDDLQTGDLAHSFQMNTIAKMEKVVLNTLNWQVTCVTPYSYIHLLIRKLGSPFPFDSLVSRSSELLLRSLPEIELVEHSARAVAAAAIRCSILELGQCTSIFLHSVLTSLIPDVELLLSQLKETYVCTDFMMNKFVRVGAESCTRGAWSWEGSCPSPVTVLPTRKREVPDCHVDIDGCFGGRNKYDGPGCPGPNKRKKIV